MRFLKERDATDHFVFCPLQADLGAGIIGKFEEAKATVLIKEDGGKDYTSAILIDEEGAHTHEWTFLCFA